MARYLDRGAPLEGVERTARDARIPFQFARNIRNFQLPDKRPLRRPGYKDHLRVSGSTMFLKQALAKNTGATLSAKAFDEPQYKTGIFATPLSYGLLRWHDDWQPKTTREWTVEFNMRVGDTGEPLVATPFERRAQGSSPASYDFVMRRPGVYVYDQTILSNYHTFNLGTPAVPGADLAFVRDNFDVFPLIGLSIGFTKTEIFAEMGLVEGSGANQGRYYPRVIQMKWDAGATLSGWYHVAVAYDPAVGSFGTLGFYVDGVLRDAYGLETSTVVFIGQYDQINGESTAQGFARHRDIVLLNECTVRGGYSSACSMTQFRHHCQTFFHAYGSGSADVPSVPWCLSPPRGTCIADLRIWHEARDATEILANKDRQYPLGAITNLKGMWFLSDGGGICTMHPDSNPTGGDADMHISLHHTYPQYIENADFIHGLGINFADGQHCILSTKDTDIKLISDIAAFMQDTFAHDPGNAVTDPWKRVQGAHDWTVMMEIKTPHEFQQEINDDPNKTTLNEFTSSSTATRRSMAIAAYALVDGGAPQFSEGSGVGSRLIRDGTSPGGNTQHHRAYDMTLFSVEGTGLAEGQFTGIGSNDGERYRVPIIRGLIDPEGHVIVEAYKDYGDTAFPYTNSPLQLRLRSTTQLQPNTVYNLAFVQRVGHGITAGLIDSDKFTLEIWIWDKSAAKPTAPDATRTITPDPTWMTNFFLSSSLNHRPSYDIIVGASYVNSGWDMSISAPNNSVSSGQTTGPWRIPQHFMSPYQDQPGFFECSMFRLWAHSVLPEDILDYMGRSIAETDYTSHLLVNLEFEEVSGYFVKNKTRYPVLFKLGYKSWGAPEAYGLQSYSDDRRIKFELQPGAWQMEDCLGYKMVDVNEINTGYVANNNQTGQPADFIRPLRVNGISSYQTTLTQRFGLVAVPGDSLVADDNVDGDIRQLYIHSNGLLNEFISGHRWRGTSIGDRTVLTSHGGVPKVFNGRNVSIAGFKPWTGGVPIVEGAINPSAGNVESDKWYGVCLVYFSEEYSIQHISPVVVLKLQSDENAISIINIPPHYDSRVTSIRAYRTLAQESSELAESAPLLPDGNEVMANAFRPRRSFEAPDSSLLPAPLDLDQDSVPLCEFSESYNGRLWLAGDYLVPDVVFFSDPGNPEKFDTLANRLVIEEGSGDRIKGLVADFGALFVFKLNSLWRIDELGGNQFQLTRIAAVGASSSDSILRFTFPDTGRSAIFFWSQHGPYVFDGSTLQYVGRPIEELDETGEAGVEYNWLDSTTVITLYDARRREIINAYQPKQGSGRATRERHTHAAVYNVLNNAWYFYTGVNIYSALSQSFTGSLFQSGLSPGTLPAHLDEVSAYKAIVGSEDGKLYQWAASQTDGRPFDDELESDSSDIVDAMVISGTEAAKITLGDGDWTPYAYAGMFLVVTDSSQPSLFQVYRILWNSGVLGRDFYVEKDDIDQKGPFAPIIGSTAHVCRTPAEIELPWDSLNVSVEDIPADKHVHELILWHDQDFFFRYASDFRELDADFSQWFSVADSDRRRTRRHLGLSRSEVLKLQLVSFELEAKLNAYGFVVTTTTGKQKEQ